MTGACVIGALLLGLVYAATQRYREAATASGERRAIVQLLSLDSTATVHEVTQWLDAANRRVVYRMGEAGATREWVYGLDGSPVANAAAAAPAALEPLGRLFVVTRDGRPAGFVVEGDTRGYKKAIRFFVAIDSSFDVAGVRVIEHEEDPGLGAETATAWFDGQFVGRHATSLDSLDVTKDPMPEDWRAALDKLDRVPVAEWRTANRALLDRERPHAIYAVTGATISSRALTSGVRTTVDHFRRRWALLAPHFTGSPS
jgi:electron transport complex protein RnfG